MIARMWHGVTTRTDADAYEAKLKPELLPGIAQAAGFVQSYLLRRENGDEVEFITIIVWESLDALKAFAGEDYETSIVPDDRLPLLLRHAPKAEHYEIRSICEATRT